MPPLDADFYTQLQRIPDLKLQELVQRVIKDTVELFGVNFKVTVETVFTTLEHTLRMVEATRPRRDFRRGELEEKRERLKQAIAAVLEASISPDSTIPQECSLHRRLVGKLRASDTIVSFNYDCVIDYALKQRGNGKWNAHYGYGFPLRPGGANLTGDDFWNPGRPGRSTINLYKLHGSLHFQVSNDEQAIPTVHLKERPYTKQHGNLNFTIIPPESLKRYNQGIFRTLWKKAGDALYGARTVVVIGYSLPPTDMHSTALFRITTRKAWLRSLVIVNPDQEARRRTREVLQRGLSEQTRVTVFDNLREFVAADRRMWDWDPAYRARGAGLA